MRIAVVSNTSWYLFNFRLNLMHALQRAGHEVIAIAPRDEYSSRIEQAGVAFANAVITSDGTNPLRELATVLQLRRLMRVQKVDLVLSNTPKGNLYTALSCIGSARAFVPNVSGLGRVFIRRNALTRLVMMLYRITFRHAAVVLFQNGDDLQTLVQARIVPRRLCDRIPGSGVDLQRFSVTPLPCCAEALNGTTGPVFLLVARMLWDKGVGEFVEAARQVKRIHPGARFRLLGFLDVANPSAISREQMQAWTAEGSVEYLGSTDDVRHHIAQADCVVLPSSYREGVPRSLLEAAASGRPVITTDMPGCRDAIVDGTTGWLCKVKDAADLAERMIEFIALPEQLRQAVGNAGRKMVEQRFDEQIVIRRYLKVLDDELHKRAPK